jgi:hypothetical protein
MFWQNSQVSKSEKFLELVKKFRKLWQKFKEPKLYQTRLSYKNHEKQQQNNFVGILTIVRGII